MKREDKKFLLPFEQHGLTFGYSSDGINYPTYCPFSEKEGKLVVNKETGQWQSFTSGERGNIYSFLSKYYQQCLEKTTPQDLSNLASNRQLPLQAFIGEVAFNKANGTYMIPVRNTEGALINISIYYPGKAIKRTAKCSVGLQNIHKITGNELPIYLCEGEWDMYAMQWAFKAIGREAVVCCVPGANVFKDHWLPVLKDRTIKVCYDNDRAGYQGQEKVAAMVRPVTKNLQFLGWPELFKNKYDVRDLFIEYAGPSFKKTNIVKTVKILDSLFTFQTKSERDNPQIPQEGEQKKVIVPSRDELETEYKKWLKMNSLDPLAVMFGTCFANKIDGDPVWTFIVAPPGGSKTELLMTLSKSPFIETMTTLTAAALISGKSGAQDHSMLPRVNGRILSIKDFTTILTGNAYERDAIFGIHRDVFDGRVDKFFGTGEKKSYVSRFGILAGVTPAIDGYASLGASLGERFLKFRLDRTVMAEDEDERIRRAISNINSESKMKDELQNMAYRYLEKKMPEKLPTMPTEFLTRIIYLAKFTAKLRGSVPKDKYTQEMTAEPITEIGTRLAKQYMKLAMGIAIHFDLEEVNAEVMRIIAQVAVDTCPGLISSLVVKIYHETKDDPAREVGQDWIVDATGLTSGTVSRMIGDLMPLKVLERRRGEHRVKCFYRLHPALEVLIAKANPFEGGS